MKDWQVKLLAVRRERCKRSFYYFFRYFWDTIVEDDLVDNWHIKYLCDELQELANDVIARKPKKYDLIINIPPGTTKSTIATIMFPVWCWVVDPAMRFITGSYSASLSTEHAVKSRDIIRSDKFKELFPEIEMKEDVDNKTNYQNQATGSRSVTSVGGAATGKHGHCLMIDDPLNPKKAASEVERKNANDWLDKTISTRKVDKRISVVILIMQRLHEEDCTGHLLKKKDKRIKHICLPGQITEDVNPEDLKDRYVDGLLDPQRMDWEVLEDMKTDLGSLGYAGQFLQAPAPLEGNLIKKKWFKYFDSGDLPPDIVKNFYTDTAYGKEGSDNSATMCYSIHRNRLYVWNMWTCNLTFPKFIEAYMDFVVSNGYSFGSRCYFEPKASGISVVQQLRQQKTPGTDEYLNIIEDEPPNDSKITRVQAMAPKIEAGFVYLYQNANWVEDFIKECIVFPNGNFDDQVDCLTAVLRLGLQLGGDLDVSSGGGIINEKKLDPKEDRAAYFRQRQRALDKKRLGF